MEIYSTSDTPEQQAAALEANGYEVVTDTPAATSAPNADAPAIPSAPGTTAGDPETPSTEPQPAVATPKKGKALQARFDELTRDRYAEKGRADELQRQLDAINAQLAGKPPVAGVPTSPAAAEAAPAENQRPIRPKKPRQSEFETQEEYEAADVAHDVALVEYEDRLSAFNRETAIREFQATQQREQAEAQREAAHEAARGKHADYDSVVFNDDNKITGALLDTVWESDNPGELLYYLGSHPDELAEFVKQTAYNDPRYALAANRNAARVIFQVQAALKGGTTAPIAPVAPARAAAAAAVPTAPQQPRTSAAPAPARPLRGASTSPSTSADPNRRIGEGGWTAAQERAIMPNNGRGGRR